ncbi:Diphthamide biosynthesis protein 4 [Scheffersomyces amazonensis]|uniref:Diphthamide biosynthesis protein 4 n=1 Tax=Scheffersomyces amazonensis TaxID=1078765 RepID=UPI00315CC2CF
MSYIEGKDIQKSYYDILGILPTADEITIKLAYREKLLSTHPDKNTSSISNYINNDEINSIKDAYKTLIDPTTRKLYDETLVKSIQRHGFNVTGEGLDNYDLNDFEVKEDNNSIIWYKDCPRCHAIRSISLTEDDLENQGTDDGMGGFDIIVQCSSCSLWIKVKYYEEDEENDNDQD